MTPAADRHHRPRLQLPLTSVAERRVAEINSAITEHEADAPIGDLRRQTEELDQAIETTWPTDGKLLALRGRAWSDLGDFPRAIELYDRATAMSDGAAPTWVADQHFNLLSRYAVALHRGETFELPADMLPTPSSLIREARRNQVVLERLGLNAERHALIGGISQAPGSDRADRWKPETVQQRRVGVPRRPRIRTPELLPLQLSATRRCRIHPRPQPRRRLARRVGLAPLAPHGSEWRSFGRRLLDPHRRGRCQPHRRRARRRRAAHRVDARSDR